jgi:hypothetical protein
MIRLKVFVSSVQKEMESERQAIRDYLRDDALLRRFFDVFLFEDLPAADRSADAVYLQEVGTSDIYLAMLGNEYGREDERGISPTHREFCEATLSLASTAWSSSKGRMIPRSTPRCRP